MMKTIAAELAAEYRKSGQWVVAAAETLRREPDLDFKELAAAFAALADAIPGEKKRLRKIAKFFATPPTEEWRQWFIEEVPPW